MGLDRADLEVKMITREAKMRLVRLTANKRAEARNLGVSDTTIGRWLDVDRLSENMPWFLVTKHSAAEELVADMAFEMGFTLVPLQKLGTLNGDIDDERNKLMIALGEWTEKYLKALSDRISPGRITSFEALAMRPVLERMLKLTATALAELDAISRGD